jgi:hypothetical protein
MALFHIDQEQHGHAHKPTMPLRSGSLTESSETSLWDSGEPSLFESHAASLSPSHIQLHRPFEDSKFNLKRSFIDWLDVWRIWYAGEFGFSVMDWTETLVLRESRRRWK